VARVAAVSTSQARVLVDNYDSFVYNLVQYLGSWGPSRWCTATTS
jgi:anthranilate/para-aminobenzoate synthase component II